MAELNILGSGSKGNCYILKTSSEVLVIDLGLSELEIKRGLGFNITNVACCLVSHKHADHSKSVEAFKEIGIPLFLPYLSGTKKTLKKQFGQFTVHAIPMLDKNMEIWQHTDADGAQCPCYGFLIEHAEIGKLLYVTDTKLITWNFAKLKLNHILIGTNYDEELLSCDVEKRSHVLTGHLNLTQACEFVKLNETPLLDNVIMCHLSDENSNANYFIDKMKKCVKTANVNVARPGLTVYVSILPF